MGHLSLKAKIDNEKALKTVNAVLATIEGDNSDTYTGTKLRFHVLDPETEELSTVDTTLKLNNELDTSLLNTALLRSLTPVFVQAGIDAPFLDEVSEDFVPLFSAWEPMVEMRNDEEWIRRIVKQLFRKNRVRVQMDARENNVEIVGLLITALEEYVPIETLASLTSPIGQDLMILIGGEYYSHIGRMIVLPLRFDPEEAAEHLVSSVEQIKKQTSI